MKDKRIVDNSLPSESMSESDQNREMQITCMGKRDF